MGKENFKKQMKSAKILPCSHCKIICKFESDFFYHVLGKRGILMVSKGTKQNGDAPESKGACDKRVKHENIKMSLRKSSLR